ncbi:Wzz/FepE/Etk N-terminal domain-containing protein [Bosea massiliensis]|uniref:Wzz/FepE/Etk N-terminal domain-containing protein n=1 Tax=Bosea massiliensis TaxID=151419 RepID=A0ABW0NYV1_9HYPH
MMLGKPGVTGAPFRVMPLADQRAQLAGDGPIALLRMIGAAAADHKITIAVWLALCLAAGFAYVRMTPPTYTAAATLLLEPRRQVLSATREVAAPPSLDLNHADSELQVIRSERLLRSVFDALALSGHPEFGLAEPGPLRALSARISAMLAGALPAALPLQRPTGSPTQIDPRRSAFDNFVRRFSARRVGQSYVLEISYASADPELTARVANAAASAYLLQSVAFKADSARSGAEFLQGRLDALASQVEAAGIAVGSGALPARPIPDADARIIGAAQTPLGPSAPRASLIMAFAGVFGLLGGLFVAAIASAFNRRVRGPQDLQRETGLSCIAVVPEVRGRRRLLPAASPGEAMLMTRDRAGSFATAIRDLATAIEIGWGASRSEGRPVVAIGSWQGGAGATLLTMNLAQLLTHRGRRVSVFSANASPAPGNNGDYSLTSLADVIASNTKSVQAAFTTVNGVHLLPLHSTSTQLNRIVDFCDPRAALVFAQAKQRGDVLIDLPSIGSSSEAMALATHADIVILVAAEGVTRFDELNDALVRLQRAGSRVMGAVINRSRS